jgi:hypothetical protein
MVKSLRHKRLPIILFHIYKIDYKKNESSGDRYQNNGYSEITDEEEE